MGLMSLKIAGVSGAVLYMVNHGLSTGALFLVIGMIYERYHTRDMDAIGGLARPMPWMAFFLILFTLTSIGLPGTNGFVSEFMVLLGTAISDQADGTPVGPLGYGYVIPAATGIILSAVYMLWMCQQALFGPLKEPPHTPDTSTGLSKDLTRREIAILAPIAVICLLIGVYPKAILSSLQPAVAANILHVDVTSAVSPNDRDKPSRDREGAVASHDGLVAGNRSLTVAARIPNRGAVVPDYTRADDSDEGMGALAGGRG